MRSELGAVRIAGRLLPTLALVLVLVSASLALFGAAGARAATTGTLTYSGCMSEPGGDLCGAQGHGLLNPYGLAISGDGANVYVAAPGSHALTTLRRGAQGQIGFGNCFSYLVGPEAGCTATADVLSPDAVTVSPDGRDAYVLDDGTLEIFSRSASGALTYVGCVDDVSNPNSCATSVPGNSLAGANSPGDVVVSVDGSFVYTATQAGGGNNGAIDVFRRNPSGTLVPLGCVEATGSTGTGCASQVPGLAGAGSLALTPSGYLLVGGEDGLASLKVAADGTLSDASCIGSASGCVPDAMLAGAGASGDGIALSPDGTNLYAAARYSGLVAELRVSGGTLTPVGCIGAGGSSECAQSAASIACPESLAVSADALDLYVLDPCTYALTTFSLASDGALSYAGCMAENGAAPSCGTHSAGLDYPSGLVVSPDDSQVLVSAYLGGSIASFARTLAPPRIAITAPASGATYTVGEAVPAAFACTAVSGGAVPVSCAGTVAAGAAIDTSAPRTGTFTVTATDAFGTQTTASVSYSVVAPQVPSPRPLIARFTQSHRRWSLRRAHRRHAPPQGTTFAFQLDAPARVTLTFSKRVAHGRKKVAGRLRIAAGAGRDRVGFSGRLGYSRLGPGSYSVALTAIASGGQASAGPLRFTIVK